MFFKALADLCFPPRCLSCKDYLEESSLLFCPVCFEKIEFIEEPFCSCCGKSFPSGENHLCGECMKKSWNFDRAQSLVLYEETVAKAIGGFKFGGRKAALQTFQKIKSLSPLPLSLEQSDFIVPVPLHINRLRKRGFNQAALLAGYFFPEEKHKIKNTILLRTKDTIPQTGLDGSCRRKNMKEAFVVKNREKIEGKNILLIDDVFTTGTTVDECARVLKSNGAQQVEVLTLARVKE